MLFYALISGTLLGLGYALPFAAPLVFVGLLPFLSFLYGEQSHKRSPGRLFCAGWLLGSVYCAIVVVWFFDALPLQWAGVEVWWQGVLLVVLAWALTAVCMGFATGLWALAASYLMRRHWSDIMLISVLFVASEYLRMWLFALLTAGPASLYGAHFSVGMLGYALASYELPLQLAKWGGVYALSVAVVAVNVLLAWLWWGGERPRRARIGYSALVAAACLLLALMPLPHRDPTDADTLRVALIATHVQSELRGKPEETYAMLAELTARIAREPALPDVIVYPEDSRFLTSFIRNGEEHRFLDLLSAHAAAPDVLVVDSDTVIDPDGKRRARMYFYTTKTNTYETRDKLFFVPQGEYMPYYLSALLRSTGQRDAERQFVQSRAYVRGDAAHALSFKDVKIGGLFCSEILSPQLARGLVDDGADILINTSSHATFNGSALLRLQTARMLQVRAVETGRYIIEAGNMFPSYVVSDRGQIIARSNVGESGVLYADIPITHTQ